MYNSNKLEQSSNSMVNSQLEEQYNKIEAQIRNKRNIKNQQRGIKRYNAFEDEVNNGNNMNGIVQMQEAQIKQLTQQNQSLQSYIEQLGAYVEESSGKYSRNIQILKDSYKQMHTNLTNTALKMEQEALINKNAATMQRQLRMAKQTQLENLYKEIKRIRELLQLQQTTTKNLKIDLQNNWRENEHQKEIWNQLIEKMGREFQEKIKEINHLNNICKDHQFQHERQSKRIQDLEKELIDRYSLPDRLHQNEIVNKQQEIVIQKQKDTIIKLEREIDILRTTNQKNIKEREAFQMKNIQYQQSFQSFFLKKIKKYQDQWAQKQHQYELGMMQLKVQLDNAQDMTKNILAEKQRVEMQLVVKQRQIIKLEKLFQDERKEKESYLNQFRNLKKNYEGVINTLQDSVRDLQSRNWALEDQKKDLEIQIQRFTDLIKQLTNVNQLATAGVSEHYIKQITKLQDTHGKVTQDNILDMRQEVQREMLSKHRNTRPTKQEKEQIKKFLDEKDEDDVDWDKLIQGINNMEVRKDF